MSSLKREAVDRDRFPAGVQVRYSGGVKGSYPDNPDKQTPQKIRLGFEA